MSQALYFSTLVSGLRPLAAHRALSADLTPKTAPLIARALAGTVRTVPSGIGAAARDAVAARADDRVQWIAYLSAPASHSIAPKL